MLIKNRATNKSGVAGQVFADITDNISKTYIENITIRKEITMLHIILPIGFTIIGHILLFWYMHDNSKCIRKLQNEVVELKSLLDIVLQIKEKE